MTDMLEVPEVEAAPVSRRRASARARWVVWVLVLGLAGVLRGATRFAAGLGRIFGFIFIGTLYMQQVLGYSALQAGGAWLATTLTALALAGKPALPLPEFVR